MDSVSDIEMWMASVERIKHYSNIAVEQDCTTGMP